MRTTSQPVDVGMPALDLVQRLPDLAPRVAKMTFVIYKPTPSLGDRLGADSPGFNAAIAEKAAEIRAASGNVVPYREAVLSAAWATSDFEAFAREATRHDAEASRDTYIHRTVDAVRAGALHNDVAALQNGDVLGLDSRCELDDGSMAHFPLMDFRMLPGISDAAHIGSAMHAVGQRSGAIVGSGRSFHFYGFEPVSQDAWIKFCARCLLLSPLTDARFIGHRLISGAAALRLTSSSVKPHIPRVEGFLSIDVASADLGERQRSPR